MKDRRDEFLMKMYDQLFFDIDRHHKYVWQIIGLLLGSFALFALSSKNVLPIDVSVSLVILMAMWVIATAYDSNYWYNRNLVIISNIEKMFLYKEDLKNIHYYFGKHRDSNAIQTSLKIQIFFSWCIVFVFLLYHFITSVIPGFYLSFSEFNWVKCLPYLSLIIFYLIFVVWIRKKRIKNYKEFLDNSPGIDIDTTGINYNDGHPTEKNRISSFFSVIDWIK